ncbi:uncharacterized protein LOC107365067 [Tetranychus urticae]|uniref:uncharacterized protein LOC107365067 n=1 Tax=Tetranychus urticae TaxID=32264 RepID=UPI000D64A731|nr:uncharacterized protein LOC107365067 [Tetranychus urticae]
MGMDLGSTVIQHLKTNLIKMRFTIFLTLCAIGVASASSLNKRSFIDDIQNQTQNAFHAFEEFSEQAKHNAEEGLKKLLDFFSQFNPQSDSSNAVNVTKRAVTGADLLANIGNPQKAQELLIQLFFESYGKGRKKRDLAENIQKLTGQAKKNAEENLKKLFDFFNQLNPQSGDSSNAVNVTKRAVTGADLLANIGNPQKAQELLIQLFFESYGKGRKRRDLAENIQKLTGQAKQNAEANLKKLFDFFSQFNPQSVDSSNAVNVTKRAVTGADLLANIGNPQKAQELLIQLFFESYGKGR